MADTPNADTLRAAQSLITEEDLTELEALLRDLIGRVDKSREDGRIYLMSQYVRLVALVTPEINRIHRRFNRETLAAMRKEHKLLKEAKKEEAPV